MGTVTNLQEYRDKKQQGGQLRPMTHEEWGQYLDATATEPDYAGVTSKVVDRCFEIIEELSAILFLKQEQCGYLSFSQAFRRGSLKMELTELSKKYGLTSFVSWL